MSARTRRCPGTRAPAQAGEAGGEEAARERPRGVMTLDELLAYAEETGDPLAHRPAPGVRYTYVLDQDEGAESPKDGHRYVPPRCIVVEGEKGRVEDEWADDPSFLDVVAFGGVGAAAARQLCKGSRVVVAGRVRQRSWEDEAGTRHYRVEIVAEDVVVCGERAKATGAPARPSQPPVAAAPAPSAPQAAPADVYDEDIPF